MTNISDRPNVFIVSPTESLMTKRGNRHPVLASNLSGYGYKVVYLTTNYYHAEKRTFTDNEIQEFILKAPYEVKVVPTVGYRKNISLKRLLGNITSATFALLYLIRHCFERDIIIVPSRPPEFVFVGALLKCARNAKVVIDVRDIWPDGLALNNSPIHNLFRTYCNIVFSLTARAGNYYMYTAPGFIEWIRRYNKYGKADFIPLGFDKDRWEKCKPLRNHDIATTIKFVFVGEFAESMAIGHFIQAIASDDRYSLTFIGGGEKLEVIKKMTERLCARNIHFKGFLPRERVVAEMQNLHITVIPMKVKYVMPNKLFDSIACFRPILVFGQNDAADFVSTTDIGWVLPFDAQESKRFLDTLSKESILRRSQNIAKIRNNFSKDFLYQKAITRIVQ